MSFVRLVLLSGLACLPLTFAWGGGAEMRSPLLAGSWYEGTREALAAQIDGFLEKVPDQKIDGRVVALISPHAGVVYSGQTAAYGYRLLKQQSVKRVVLLGPSHREPLSGASIPVAKAFVTPLGAVPLDREACDKLVASGVFKPDRNNQQAEHSLEIQLPFLQRVLDEFLLVPIMVGHLSAGDASKLAERIKPLLDDETVLVASSDFTHYGEMHGYVPFSENIRENLVKLDGGATDFILKKDSEGFVKYLEKTGATICGSMPIEMMLCCLPEEAAGRQIHYSLSGDMTGGFSMSVSYVSVAFFLPETKAK